ncbi:MULTISPECIES: hypothetical protein [Vibrio harveyi group]|uniref:Uncharacterized protein n=3 Tax=Vibrio harveyi group TaxID=717610 RepID=A0AAX1XGN2_9VIBR|nr:MULTISPECIES: hypothetical protein [Vibrio harveyi group]EKY4878757.1 hypothetical protein [Vibrio alginolyticus]EKO3860424.1 hypothetical protein [Vibrio harveyi]MBE4116322.1 hypothetical protein [Vibrio parahaemolyticus]MCR9770312.1 hypothetical protein [Vibrio harveyi]MCS0347609.1 hypothetical protein [Vibrio diabolicus]
MKLDKYVEETIKQVISGVQAAKTFGDQNGAKVNPATATFKSENSTIIYCYETGVPIQEISFDVAVSVSESSSEQSTPEITVGSITTAGSGMTDSQSSSLNRIKFSIPVLLPVSE